MTTSTGTALACLHLGMAACACESFPVDGESGAVEGRTCFDTPTVAEEEEEEGVEGMTEDDGSELAPLTAYGV